MAGIDALINAFTPLLVTTDPPGLAPIFLGLTAGMTRSQRKQTALRGTIIGFVILNLIPIGPMVQYGLHPRRLQEVIELVK